jgi:hypothetical protein
VAANSPKAVAITANASSHPLDRAATQIPVIPIKNPLAKNRPECSAVLTTNTSGFGCRQIHNVVTMSTKWIENKNTHSQSIGPNKPRSVIELNHRRAAKETTAHNVESPAINQADNLHRMICV